MSLPSNRRRQPGGMEPQIVALLVITGIVVVTAGLVYAAVKLGYQWAGLRDRTPNDPFQLLADLASGKVAWPAQATWVALLTVAGLTALVVAVVVVWRRGRARRSRVDHAAAFLGHGRDIIDLTHKATHARAHRLTADPATTGPGIPIGVTVRGNQRLFGSWEDLHIDVWGPRQGKTTSRAIPALLAAPGAVIATSNKRDLTDATRDVRATTGPVWVFDPQGVAGEEPSWWWNPLDFVVDELTAAELAGHFAAAGRPADAKTDAYFDPAAEDLLAGLLLAAALDGRAITDVWSWLTRPLDEAPVAVLTAHGVPLKADQVAAVAAAPEKQREGVYGTARQMASCLTYRSVARWVTPRARHDPRPRFRPEAFVRGTGTLYSLSREGAGNAGALVTALTVACVRAAEDLATASPGGRLPVPLVGVLDEAANVCRWRDLPQLYSHYGSRGIVLMTILQSWSQGVRVWGEHGMNTLWSAATIKVYGGGVAEDKFLDQLSNLVGDYDKATRSSSHSRGHRTISHQLHRERIMTVADLAALPKGRAVVIAAGSRPTLVKTIPWMDGPYAQAVQASIDAHTPAAAAAP